MKIKVAIPKIHCKRTTAEIGKDEIYYGIIISSLKQEDDLLIFNEQTSLLTHVSATREKVKAGTVWTPNKSVHELQLDDHTVAIAVTLVLYEEDKGDIKAALKESFDEILKPDKFDWLAVLKDARDAIIEDSNKDGNIDLEDIVKAITKGIALTPMIIAGFAFNVLKRVFKHFRQDDLLGQVNDVFILGQDGFSLPREYEFRQNRGKYVVAIQVNQG